MTDGQNDGKTVRSDAEASSTAAAPTCELCGDTGIVEVIPHGADCNDAIEDECPHCLRDEITPGWRR